MICKLYCFITSESWPCNVVGDYHHIKTMVILMQFPTLHVLKFWTSLKSEKLIINSIEIKTAARWNSISMSDYVFSSKGTPFTSLRIQAKILTVVYSLYTNQPPPFLFWTLFVLMLLLTLLLHTVLTIPRSVSLSLGLICNVLNIVPQLISLSLCSDVTLQMPTYHCHSI